MAFWTYNIDFDTHKLSRRHYNNLFKIEFKLNHKNKGEKSFFPKLNKLLQF